MSKPQRCVKAAFPQPVKGCSGRHGVTLGFCGHGGCSAGAPGERGGVPVSHHACGEGVDAITVDPSCQQGLNLHMQITPTHGKNIWGNTGDMSAGVSCIARATLLQVNWYWTCIDFFSRHYALSNTV